ncbi:OLC1v1021412C1 [Oldenlandia corymbosa var. corymbosa]|uniref:Glycosyltransferase n=1 Tax=Oldenlandia corymbosa var. corymbosa TaxID=529605 RepID=A0AAV1BXV4_OLDCO|nr:OLC1v1021412C1 [Oldenlandia corymbosa var. corymbosa]
MASTTNMIYMHQSIRKLLSLKTQVKRGRKKQLENKSFAMSTDHPEDVKQNGRSSLSIAMYPWFAMGHLTAFLHMANKLAERGHRISFFHPKNTISKLQNFNLYPDLLNFIPLDVPQVEGLPPGSETTADIPFPLQPFLRLAMDKTQPQVESLLKDIKPDFVFFDFTHWLPSLARGLGIKSVFFITMSPATMAYTFRREPTTDADLMKPPEGFPSSSSVKLLTHEARGLNFFGQVKEIGIRMTFLERLLVGTEECDAISFKTCREMEGPYCGYLEKKFQKPVILAGPVVPVQPASALEENWAEWLSNFKDKSIIYCAFGSEFRLQKDQFQELILGLEKTGLPFLAALKPPFGSETIEMALPNCFEVRNQGKGIVYDGWVQQQLILAHPAIGCFVTHCGSGSLSEALVSDCQIVLLPQCGDQFINARVMGGDLKAGVEVKKGDEDGLFTSDAVCEAIQLVMDENSEVGMEVRANHVKWKDFLLRDGLESSYTDEFIHRLRGLLNE